MVVAGVGVGAAETCIVLDDAMCVEVFSADLQISSGQMDKRDGGERLQRKPCRVRLRVCGKSRFKEAVR